jgi:hypothetical protein
MRNALAAVVAAEAVRDALVVMHQGREAVDLADYLFGGCFQLQLQAQQKQ